MPVGSLRRIGLTAVAFLLAGCDRQPAELRLVADDLLLNRAIAESVRDQTTEGEGPPIVMIERGGASSLDMLAHGQADLALIENTTPFREGVSSLIPVYTGVLHVAYREDHDPTLGPEQLAGARVFAGSRESLSYVLLQSFLSHAGLEPDDVDFVTAESEGFEPGRMQPEVISVFGPISPERAELMDGYRLYSMGSPDMIGRGSIVDGIRTRFPQLRPYVIPVGTYGELTPEPVVTLAVDMVLVGRSDLDDTAVYDLIDRLVTSRPALAKRYPPIFDGMRSDFDPSSLNFPLHPGAQRYLDRDEPTIYERFADVVDAGVTVLLALLSGSLALMRYIAVRRKNRIDDFYKRLLAIRDAARAGPDPAQRHEAARRVAALQDEAFRLLIGEKLAADESFRIFVTLSHDVLRELRDDGLIRDRE